MIESITKALNALRNSTILFGDQNIGHAEKDGISYNYVALTEEQLQTIEHGLNEQVALQDQILSTFETNQNAAFLIRIADGLAPVRGSRFDWLEGNELTNGSRKYNKTRGADQRIAGITPPRDLTSTFRAI